MTGNVPISRRAGGTGRSISRAIFSRFDSAARECFNSCVRNSGLLTTAARKLYQRKNWGCVSQSSTSLATNHPVIRIRDTLAGFGRILPACIRESGRKMGAFAGLHPQIRVLTCSERGDKNPALSELWGVNTDNLGVSAS